MLDLSGVPMLDVAIGLAFMFFLLSVVCSSIGEVIAAVFKLRAKNLETGIRSLLGDPALARRFFEDWRITPLAKPSRPRRQRRNLARHQQRESALRPNGRRPAYIDPRTAALVLVETVLPDAAQEAIDRDAQEAPSRDLHVVVGRDIDRIKAYNPQLAAFLQDIVDHASDDVTAARRHVEDRFNEVMDRATGWYKRRMQLVVFFVALAVAGAINADTFNVADRLARDEPLRSAVVTQAVAAASATTPGSTGVPANTDTGRPGDPASPDTVRRQISAARATALPLGWTGENVPAHATFWNVMLKALGVLVTAFALLLGAPFWFDVLGKFARLRSTGNRIGTPKDDNTAPSDRDDRRKRS